MSNEQLIKSAHVWAVAAVLFGTLAFAGIAGSHPAHSVQQNANNANTPQNRNANQNRNENVMTNRNSNNSNNSNEAGAAANTSGMESKDQKFLMETAMGGLMEVELGRWASQKGTSPEVKQFGQKMVADHTAANTELMTLASAKGVTLPTQLDEKHQKEVSKITRLSGANFDRAYSKAMLKDHENAVKDFEKQSTSGTDADIKAFASKTLPTLQEHLQMVRALPGNMGSGSGNSNANSNDNRSAPANRNTNGNSNNGNSNRP